MISKGINVSTRHVSKPTKTSSFVSTKCSLEGNMFNVIPTACSSAVEVLCGAGNPVTQVNGRGINYFTDYNRMVTPPRRVPCCECEPLLRLECVLCGADWHTHQRKESMMPKSAHVTPPQGLGFCTYIYSLALHRGQKLTNT